ncbi:response regulator [Xenophilus arseniciresistens]|uniref:Response regulator n=1 Tax=Xenophilus arseniciresistens TaxID=1283306 RepID=A0AAE3N9Q9_9BURK|nr:response regulator [Xenophilus arseniciresistens]MDA7418620.1 response regulator [Xenophilus arseniciresistens]
MRLLLAEDEAALADWLVKALAQSGCSVDWVADGRLVRRAMRCASYDALILDLGLPGLDGHDVLSDIRESDNGLPILVLTARDTLAERVATLRGGADDFLAKPFEVEELEARLLALVRRSRGRESARFSCGSLHYDATAKRFMLGAEPLTLTGREHAVLRTLIQSPGEPMSKPEILDKVFTDESDASPEVVEVIVHRLRKRLAGSDVQVTTLRGLGYVLEQSAP